MGIETAIAIAALTTAAAGTAMSITQANKKAPDALPMPEAPKEEDAAQKAKEEAARKRSAMARSQTVFTSPLGLQTEAQTARKALLGQ